MDWASFMLGCIAGVPLGILGFAALIMIVDSQYE